MFDGVFQLQRLLRYVNVVLYTVFIAELAPHLKILIKGTLATKMVVFAVFRLHRVRLGDLSTYFIDFLLLVKDDLS